MPIGRSDVLQMLREDNESLKQHNSQLTVKLSRNQQTFRALNEMIAAMEKIDSRMDLVKLIHDLLLLVLHACDSENGSILLLDEETNELVFVEVIGEAKDDLMNYRIDASTGIAGAVFKSQQAQIVDDVHNSPDWYSDIDREVGFKTQKIMCAPLMINSAPAGVLEVINISSNGSFSHAELDILCVAAKFVAIALEKVEGYFEKSE